MFTWLDLFTAFSCGATTVAGALTVRQGRWQDAVIDAALIALMASMMTVRHRVKRKAQRTNDE